METKAYYTENKSSWPRGPWDGEIDKKQWRDEATGYPCLIVRGYITGALCGYVGVPKNHPAFELPYEQMAQIEVHGGLTYSAFCRKGKEEEGICHTDKSDDPVWWFGFDCAHAYDESPKMLVYLTKGQPTLDGIEGNVYRDEAYVTAEVQKLAQQLKTMEK